MFRYRIDEETARTDCVLEVYVRFCPHVYYVQQTGRYYGRRDGVHPLKRRRQIERCRYAVNDVNTMIEKYANERSGSLRFLGVCNVGARRFRRRQ